jgi:excinuclease ABC subunit B
MYGDSITASMATTIEETASRRSKQEAYNKAHGIEPQQIKKQRNTLFEQNNSIEDRPRHLAAEPDVTMETLSADPVVKAMGVEALKKTIQRTKKAMEIAAKELDFMEAARLRDEFLALQKLADSKK